MSRIRVMSGLCVALLVTACSDFTASGDPLTEAEAGELAGVLAQQGFVGFEGINPAPMAAPGGAAREPAEKITVTINDSAPCEGGGTVALAGKLEAEFSEQSESGSIKYEYTLTPNGCEVTTDAGKVFTLTGDPNLKANGELNADANGFDGSLDYEGKFEWTADDGRSGVCGVNLSANYELALDTEDISGSASLSGEVCGVNVNRSLEFES